MSNSLKVARIACFPDGEDTFGRTVISAPTDPVTQLTVAVDEESVFSDRKLIEFSEFSWPKSAKEAERLCGELLPLCAEVNESDDIILIFYTTPYEFDAGDPPRRPSKLFELLTEECTPIKYDLESEAKLVKWMGRRAAALGATLQPAIAQEIITRAGRNMACLIGEVEKAAFTVLSSGRDVIEKSDLSLTVNNEEINAFDFENALRSGNFERALAIVKEHEKDKDPAELVSAVIFNYASNAFFATVYRTEGKRESEFASALGLNPYVASIYYRYAAGKDIKEAEQKVKKCSEADLLLKKTGSDSVGYMIIEKLLYELIGKNV